MRERFVATLVKIMMAILVVIQLSPTHYKEMAESDKTGCFKDYIYRILFGFGQKLCYKYVLTALTPWLDIFLDLCKMTSLKKSKKKTKHDIPKSIFLLYGTECIKASVPLLCQSKSNKYGAHNICILICDFSHCSPLFISGAKSMQWEKWRKKWCK